MIPQLPSWLFGSSWSNVFKDAPCGKEVKMPASLLFNSKTCVLRIISLSKLPCSIVYIGGCCGRFHCDWVIDDQIFFFIEG